MKYIIFASNPWPGYHKLVGRNLFGVFMNDYDDLKIAGDKTIDDWKKYRSLLFESDDTVLWEEAFNSFFMERVNKRYLDPVKVLQENSTYQGEGFSILTILCSLIEFLESLVQGKKYRYRNNRRDTLNIYEYDSSKNIYIDFLTQRCPFNKYFDATKATEFFISIRCGLLHEAGTKNQWRIHAKSYNDIIVDFKSKIVFRDNFQKSIHLFIEDYKRDLVVKKELREAFIRKFDFICE